MSEDEGDSERLRGCMYLVDIFVYLVVYITVFALCALVVRFVWYLL